MAGRSAGVLGRFGLLKPIDMLVTQTDLKGPSEWETISHGFAMLVPLEAQQVKSIALVERAALRGHGLTDQRRVGPDVHPMPPLVQVVGADDVENLG